MTVFVDANRPKPVPGVEVVAPNPNPPRPPKLVFAVVAVGAPNVRPA